MDEYRARGAQDKHIHFVGGDVTSFFTEKERVKNTKILDQAKAGGYSGC